MYRCILAALSPELLLFAVDKEGKNKLLTGSKNYLMHMLLLFNYKLSLCFIIPMYLSAHNIKFFFSSNQQ